jgi:hypothetical protein
LASSISHGCISSLPTGTRPPNRLTSLILTLSSVADSRVVPKLQFVNPYPSRSAWQRVSVAVVATRDCTFHYVSDNCPQAELKSSRDLISFLLRYFNHLIYSSTLSHVLSPAGMKKHLPTWSPFLALAVNSID